MLQTKKRERKIGRRETLARCFGATFAVAITTIRSLKYLGATLLNVWEVHQAVPCSEHPRLRKATFPSRPNCTQCHYLLPSCTWCHFMLQTGLVG